MKTETCVYSGYKIHPGHGKRIVRTDGKVQIFLNAKCEASHKMKRNPRKINWTVFYRRQHKKGAQAEEVTRKTKRRAVRFQRAIGNTTLEAILAKRNQKPEFRRQQQEQAIKAAKEKARTAKATKKPATIKAAKPKEPKQKAAQKAKPAAPKVGVRR